MSKKKARTLRWVRLDNAAKIYPAARRRNWSNVFRQSVTLSEPVDVGVLQSALNKTVLRFPTIAASLRRGLFWFYLQQVENPPTVKEEYSYPLVFMNGKELRRCALRVIAYENRIAAEFFHSLTDGTGALIFLKTLTAEYLEQKYGVTVPAEKGVLSRDESPKAEELEDSFQKYAGRVPMGRRATNAWHMSGDAQPNGFLNLTCFTLDTDEVHRKAREYGVSITVFTAAVTMAALQNLQAEQNPHRRRRKPVKVLIPVNLRRLFKSSSLRNFAMYTVPEIDPRLGEYSFEEILRIVYHKMGTEITPKHMGGVIAKNVGDEKNPLVRLIPLPLKNAVMKAIFDSVGERKSCLSVSNLGNVELPEIMKQYVKRMDFILGVQAAAPYNCGILSYDGVMYINFIRNIKAPDLERHFFAVLRDLGLKVTVQSNRD